MTKVDKENWGCVGMVLIFAAILFTTIYYYNKPDFKPGDCLGQKHLEPWEHDDMLYKVLMVGKNQYHLTYTFANLSVNMGKIDKGKFDTDPEGDQVIDNKAIGFIDDYYKKVKCP